MKRKELKLIETQLKNDPNNLSLKLKYGQLLYKAKKYKESEHIYRSILKKHADNIDAKQGLASIYYKKGNYSTVIVIAEDLSQKSQTTEKIRILHIKSLWKQNSIDEAQELYNKLISENPFIFDDELLEIFEENGKFDDEYLDNDESDQYEDDYDDYDDFDDFDDFPFGSFGNHESDFLNILDDQILIREGFNTFQNVLGMNEVKKMMIFKFSFFTDDDELFEKNNREARGSMMMYGPTGTGKNHIMKSFNREFLCPIIPIDLSNSYLFPTTDKSKLFDLSFSHAQIIRPVALFIDNLEIFAPIQGNSVIEDTIRTFQTFEKLEVDYSQIGVIAATNKPWAIDDQMFRYGRIDDVIFTPPPNAEERRIFIEHHLIEYQKRLRKYLDEIVEKTKGCTVPELDHIINTAFYINGDGSPLDTTLKINALRLALERTDPIVKYWLEDLKKNISDNKRQQNLFHEALSYTIE